MTQNELNDYIIQQIKPIVEAAVLAEREACAKVCEEIGGGMSHPYVANNCAAAIRDRGEKNV